MRLIPLATCEKEFLKNCFQTNSRSDGRTDADFRPVTLNFGREYGSCIATFGKTKVFAKVTSSFVVPRPNRPSSGVFVVNIELSPMACSYFEGSRPDMWIEMQRLLERMLKESNCVELESLCILAGEKVWQIRCDVHVIDNDGSILDCAMFAAMGALKHFRRPVVSISGQQFTIHSPTERAMIPLTVYSCSFCVSTGLCKQGGTTLVSDLTDREEMAVEEIVVIAMNSYREVSLLHTRKFALIDLGDILRCQACVSDRVNYLTALLNDALKRDSERRMANEQVHFGELIREDILGSMTHKSQQFRIHKTENSNCHNSTQSSNWSRPTFIHSEAGECCSDRDGCGYGSSRDYDGICQFEYVSMYFASLAIVHLYPLTFRCFFHA